MHTGYILKKIAVALGGLDIAALLTWGGYTVVLLFRDAFAVSLWGIAAVVGLFVAACLLYGLGELLSKLYDVERSMRTIEKSAHQLWRIARALESSSGGDGESDGAESQAEHR